MGVSRKSIEVKKKYKTALNTVEFWAKFSTLMASMSPKERKKAASVFLGGTQETDHCRYEARVSKPTRLAYFSNDWNDIWQLNADVVFDHALQKVVYSKAQQYDYRSFFPNAPVHLEAAPLVFFDKETGEKV